MRVGVLREMAAGETRMALRPEVMGRRVQSGGDVSVTVGAGAAARFPGVDDRAAGTHLLSIAKAVLAPAELLLNRSPRSPDPDRPLTRRRRGGALGRNGPPVA